MSPRRASEWLLALTEAPEDGALRARFAEWITESPEHERDWQEMAHTYAVMGMTVPAFKDDWSSFAAARTRGEKVTLRELATATAPRRHARRGGVFLRIAQAPKRAMATVAAVACVLLVLEPVIQLRLQADHVTATAEMRVVRLDDGSTVRLGPQSAVAVNYSPGARDVRLLKGEAFFEVARNPARPFRVAANGTRTTVLGTAFDVRLADVGVEVGVSHGHVRVDYDAVDPHVSEQLRAGDWLKLGWDGRILRNRMPPAQAGSRVRGELIAKDTSVAEVIDAIRPWYSGVIILRGERLARQPMTGVYRLSDPVDAVRAVAEAQGARVQRITPWVLVVSAR